jgi:predicted neuraminidase
MRILYAVMVLSLGIAAPFTRAQSNAAQSTPMKGALQEGRSDATASDLLDPQVVALANGQIRNDPGRGISEAYLPVLFPSSHAANLIELKDGDLLCVWFSGHWEGDSNVGIVFSRLRKGTQRWSEPHLIDRQEGVSFQNPVLFQAPDGVIHLYHTTHEAHQGEANAHVLESVSHDNGITWSPPVLLFGKPGAFTRHPLLLLPDSTWLLPMTYVTSKGIGEGSETNYSVMELSHDAGKTWKECMVPQSFARVQPTVVQPAPGQLLSFFRSRKSDFIYQSSSKDGCQWTEPTATILPNNNASVQAFRLQDGHLIIVFDNQHNGPRRPVSIALSEDNGRTWKYVRDIETGRPELGNESSKVMGAGREEYSYPSVLQTRDGLIHVAYTFRRQTIKVISFREEWIRKGGTVGLYKGASSEK